MAESDKFLVYRLRQVVAGGPLAYDAIATDEAADRIGDLTYRLETANAFGEQCMADIDRLTAECEALRRDAERYRWIRERAGGSTCDFEVVEDAAWAAKYGAPHNFDMNIDEAMTAARQKEAKNVDG